jgi:Lon protease-like protein
MDLFNKKRIKELQIVDETLRNQKQKLIKELEYKDKQIKELEKDKDNQTKEISRLLDDSQNLVQWIQKILEVARIYDCKNELDTITIPINKTEKRKLDGLERPYVQTDIIIPSIHFSFSNVDYDIDSTWIR